MATQKKAGTSEYEVSLDNGLDFAITRINTKTQEPTEIFVMMPSQNQYYIKNLKTGRLSKVTTANLEGFFDSFYEKRNGNWYPDSMHLQCNWLHNLSAEKELWKGLEACSEDERFVPSAKTGRFVLDQVIDTSNVGRYSNNFDKLNRALERTSASWRFMRSYEKNYKSATQEELTFAEAMWPATKVILEEFGLDNARVWSHAMYENGITQTDGQIRQLGDYMRRLLKAPISNTTACVLNNQEQTINVSNTPNWGGTEGQYPDGKGVIFDFKTLLRYATETLIDEGYLNNPKDFYETWYDTLALEATCYNRIVDKYPTYLRSTHQALSAMASRMTYEIDPKQEAEAVLRMSKMDWTPTKGDYFVTHPTKMDDLRTEAQEQSNCLASYIDSVARGDTQIMFLRKKEDPAHAFVTIEVDMDGRITQALGRFNQEPAQDAWESIARWAKARNLDISPVEHRIQTKEKK